MKSKIIQEFKGEIEGVVFSEKNVYSSCEFILEKIEEKFGEIYNKEFVSDLKNTIERMEVKYDEFSYSVLENDFYESIEEAKAFNKIKFSYYGSDWKIEELNKNIKENIYEEVKDSRKSQYTIPKKKKENEENER